MPASDPHVTIVDAAGATRRVSLDAYLEPAAIEAAEREANAWIKRLRHARIDGAALRDRFTYRGDSLWWFVELYLHKQRTVVSAFRTIAALESLIARERPSSLACSGSTLGRLLVAQAAVLHGLATSRPQSAPGFWRLRAQLLARGRFHTIAAVADRLRPIAPARPGQVDVVAFVHSAFWRRDHDEEGYVGPVLKELERHLPAGRVALVGLGPRTNFRERRWRHRLAEFNDPSARELPLLPVETLAGWRAIRASLAVWRDRARVLHALLESEDVRAAAVLRGYDIWPALRLDLLGVSHLQMPWSARSMDEAGAALDALKPRVAVTYAEAGGWGRALALETRRRGIPLVGLQHGFIYRHWLNYLHETDEVAPSPCTPSDVGFPRPALTLVYDGFARHHLIEAGHFPPDSVAVTGSPKLETFARAGRRLTEADRTRIRRETGATAAQKLVVLATKFTQVADWFRALVEAVASMSDVFLAVKCHPAEAPGPYERVAGSARNVRILTAGTDLGTLVACSDLIVTVNSTAAIEAMALEVPGLVLAIPNNLSPFVEAGALAGVEDMAHIGTALRRLLYDEAERQTLAERRRAFIEKYGMVSEGGAAARAADAILQLADLGSGHSIPAAE